jgi:hypothetical protein
MSARTAAASWCGGRSGRSRRTGRIEGLRLNPSGTVRRHVKYPMDDIAALVAHLKDVRADKR